MHSTPIEPFCQESDNPEPSTVSSQDEKIPARDTDVSPENAGDDVQPDDAQPDNVQTDDEPQPDDGPAEPLALSQTDITLPAGETGRLTVTGGTGSVSWSSSNPEIASVDGGAVTGKAGGTVTITATSGEETATCQVKVEGDPWVNPNASSFRLSKDDFTLAPSESTWQMKIKWDNSGSWEIVGPEDGVVWATNNPSVATISETGEVTRAGKGTTQITATVGGVTLECTVRMR